MKNIFLFITLVIISLSYFYQDNLKKYYSENILGIEIKTLNKSTKIEIGSSGSVEITGNNIEKNKTNTKDRINILRKRFALRGLIIAGDLHLENSRLTLALQKYLEAYKQNSKDEGIIEKIAETYFEMKKYKLAYKNFEKIISSTVINKEKAILSYLYSNEINSTNMDEIISNIDLFGLNKEETFFYKNSIKCLNDYNQCKLDFSKYFEENKDLKSEQLLGIKNTIKNYRDFKVDEVYYKNFLISVELFKSKLYPIAIKLGKDILVDKSDYKNVMKVIGKSYFELGKYKNAKTFLSKYYELDDNDADVTYLLGVISIKLHDYLLASIHLKNTLKIGYPKTINIKRRLIYAYYELGETEKMLREFDILIKSQGSNLSPEDISLGIYYNIINDNKIVARKFSKKGIELFPKEGIFYGYLGWMERDAGNMAIAEENLKKGLKLDSRNPLILLNLGQIFLNKGSTIRSMIYFKKTLKIDKGGVFGEAAKEWLEKVNIKIKEEKEKKKKEKL